MDISRDEVSSRKHGFDHVYYGVNQWYTISKHVPWHNSDAIMGEMASQITSLTIVYSTVYSGADQRKHQSSASLAFVRGIHRGPVNSTHKWPVTQKTFPFDDVIMSSCSRFRLDSLGGAICSFSVEQISSPEQYFINIIVQWVQCYRNDILDITDIVTIKYFI